MTIDQHLIWSKHVEEKSKKIFSAIGALKRIGPIITIASYSLLFHGLGVILLDKLQKLQNRAARIITQSDYYTNARSLLE